jgi:integrase
VQAKRSTPTGLRIRHSRQCGSATGAKCNCVVSVEAWAWDKRTQKKIRKTFTGAGAQAAAKGWRRDASGAVERGTLRASTQTTLREAAAAWLEGAKRGAIRNRSGDVFKPSTLHGYEHSLNHRVLPRLGSARISAITSKDLRDFVEQMLADGLDPSTIRNALMPLRGIFGRAIEDGALTVSPVAGIRLPAVRGRRDRIADTTEAAGLLSALPAADRALWATALYAGLRRGELMALRWDDIDLAGGVIRVERSYDPRSGTTVAPKSHAGTRRVPILAALRDHLDQHKLDAANTTGLVFARADGQPFSPSANADRSATAWKAAAIKRARADGATDDELEALAKKPFDALTLHEARHSFASMMIAAGVNAKALSTFMGHSSVTITYDRYGHLMPGSEDEAAKLADAYLDRANTGARIAQVGERHP